MDVELRPARPGDLEPLTRLVTDAMRAHVEATLGHWRDAETRDAIATWIADDATRVLFCGAETIGVMRVLRAPDAITLDQLHLAPAHQGRGLGTRLLTELIDDARRADVPIRLRVLRANPARRLYERLGFAVVSETEVRIFMEWRARG
jgi:ribosomal protein S18 acetylase RimI-like enzyme